TAEGSHYWAAGKIGQYAVGLNGGWVLVEDEGNTPELRPGHKASVMAWINLAQRSSSDIKVVVKGRDNHETYGLEVNDEYDGLTFLMRDGNGLDGGDPQKYDIISEQELPLDEWVHIAGTYDGNEMTSYVNGEVEGTTTPGPDELYSDANDGFGIGGRWGDSSGRFVGEIDDVRVYDYGLSQAEVAWIATQGDGVFLLTSQANLYLDDPNPEVINFKDFARLFDYWGDEQLWPPQPEP
ncbi:MAG: LamG domain-containing protein, partial [Planctomycetota bacterium]